MKIPGHDFKTNLLIKYIGTEDYIVTEDMFADVKLTYVYVSKQSRITT